MIGRFAGLPKHGLSEAILIQGRRTTEQFSQRLSALLNFLLEIHKMNYDTTIKLAIHHVVTRTPDPSQTVTDSRERDQLLWGFAEMQLSLEKDLDKFKAELWSATAAEAPILRQQYIDLFASKLGEYSVQSLAKVVGFIDGKIDAQCWPVRREIDRCVALRCDEIQATAKQVVTEDVEFAFKR